MVAHHPPPLAPTAVPPPPVPFDPLPHTLESGSLLHRVHHHSRAGNAFNPGVGAETRFAHFDGGAGVVPSLYAAATAEAAICESLLHEVPLTGGILPRAEYETRTLTALELQRDVRLAMLMGPGLRRLGISAQDITATNGNVYGATARWAHAAHAAGFEGLAWISSRDNTAEAYVLFGDRVHAADLRVTDLGLGTFTPGSTGFLRLDAYCSLVNVDLLLA